MHLGEDGESWCQRLPLVGWRPFKPELQVIYTRLHMIRGMPLTQQMRNIGYNMGNLQKSVLHPYQLQLFQN